MNQIYLKIQLQLLEFVRVLVLDLEIIEPCGFLFTDKRFKRVVMDYMDEKVYKILSKLMIEFFSKKKIKEVILL